MTSIRVLLAEDQSFVSHALIEILKGDKELDILGNANNGEIAVRLTNELLPEVVVMDIQMPVLNGIEATKRIRKESPRTRILGISMYTDRPTIKAMVAAGATGYISKDTAFEELLPAIHALMKGNTYFPAEIAEALSGGAIPGNAALKNL